MAPASSRRTSFVVSGSAAAFSLHGHPRNGFRKASTASSLFDSGARIANDARRREGRYYSNAADLTIGPALFDERSEHGHRPPPLRSSPRKRGPSATN